MKTIPKANEGVVRVGGGFSIPVPPPKASPKKKAFITRKPKAKPKACATAVTDEAVFYEAELPVEEELTPEDTYQREVCKAMVTADHFLGLLKFERAADELEEQLAKLSEETCLLRNSDLHIEVLLKYAGILWWDSDLEAALDAFTAADEILSERLDHLHGETVPESADLKQRQAHIWTQQAQVHRLSGDLKRSEERLTEAITCLTELQEVERSRNVSDALRDAQAALGQIYVQKKDFVRAEQLYLAAFDTQVDD